MVVWFIIDTHQPSPLPPARHLTYEDAQTIAHANENFSLGIYGVIRKDQD